MPWTQTNKQTDKRIFKKVFTEKMPFCIMFGHVNAKALDHMEVGPNW